MPGDNKDPSYPWYPRDFANDEPVQLMSLEAEGAYHRLLDHQWLNGSIPADIGQLAAICKRISTRTMRKLWPSIAPLFVPFTPEAGHPDRLYNRKLERIRAERSEYRAKLSEAGKRGADTRWGHGHPNSHPSGAPMATPLRPDKPASASASALALAPSSHTHSRGEKKNGKEVESGGQEPSATDQLRASLPEQSHQDLDFLLAHVPDVAGWCGKLVTMVEGGECVPGATYQDLGNVIHDLRLNGKATAPSIGLVRGYLGQAVRSRQKLAKQVDPERTGRGYGMKRVAPVPAMKPLKSVLGDDAQPIGSSPITKVRHLT